MTAAKYLRPLIEAFEQNAEPDQAARMKKYMKDRFDYFGVKAGPRTEIARAFVKEHGWFDAKILVEVVHHLWNQPQRELQYVAIDFAVRYLKKASPDDLDLIEFMLTEKSWWDSVDLVATKCAGNLLKRHPELIQATTEKWMDSGNMWLQRTCLLFQLKYKAEVDTELMVAFIFDLRSSKEFFIQKAIGWVLREYSKTNSMWVIDFIDQEELPPLSRREGLKWLQNQGRI